MSHAECNRRWKAKRLLEHGCIKCSREALPNKKYCNRHKPNTRRTGITSINHTVKFTPLALEFMKSKNLIVPEVFRYALKNLGFNEWRKKRKCQKI